MPRLLYTVENLISEVQSQTDEFNQDTVDIERDILPCLNRGQDFGVDIYSRRYPDPWIKTKEVSIVAGTTSLEIPEDCFEDRVIRLTLIIGQQTNKIKRVDYDSFETYQTTNQGIPLYYTVVGRELRISQPSISGTLRLAYIRSPEKLVRPQGRITEINLIDNYLRVDVLGELVTTSIDELGCFINVVDGQTGEIKQTLQVLSLENDKVTFRSNSPSRTKVLGRDISLSILEDVELDDYICLVDGSCVCYFGRPTSNFLIQYAVNEIRRKLGLDAMTEEQVLEKFTKQMEKTTSGRENTKRIKKASSAWRSPSNTRRWFF